MKTIFVFVYFLAFSFFSQSTFAVSGSRFRGMVGVGEGLSPSSYRIGIGSYDLGLLNRSSLGIAQNFYHGKYYVSFGPAYVYRVSGGPGFFGGAGMDLKYFDLVYLKLELNTGVSFNNYSFGSALIGLVS